MKLRFVGDSTELGVPGLKPYPRALVKHQMVGLNGDLPNPCGSPFPKGAYFIVLGPNFVGDEYEPSAVQKLVMMLNEDSR